MPASAASGEQRVGWLELFFDLVFVVAIAQLAGLGERHPDLGSVGVIAGVLVAVWATWNNTTLYVNMRGGVSARSRLLVFVSMAGVGVMATAIPTITGAGQVPFVIGYVIARVAMWPLWTREVRAEGRSWIGPLFYGPGLGALWIATIAIPGPFRWIGWAALLAVELILVAAELPGARHDAGHMIERVGLFIMIVLGESVFVLIMAITAHPDAASWTLGALGFAVVCALWWRYVELTNGLRERMTQGASGSIFRDVLVIAHYVVVLGLILLAAGLGGAIEHAGDSHLPSGVLFVLLSGLGVYELSQLIMAARFAIHPAVALLKIGPTGVVIAIVVLLGQDWTPAVIVGALLIGTIAQLGMSTLLRRLTTRGLSSSSSPSAAAPRS